MKRILSILMVALTLCYPLAVIAQPEPGTFSITPKVGGNASMLIGNPDMQITSFKIPDYNWDNDSWHTIEGPEDMVQVISTTFCSSSLHYGWNGGVETSYQLSTHWALAGSLEYSLQGNNYDDYSSTLSTNQEIMSFTGTRLSMHYLNVPLLARYYFYSNFAFEFGIQPGWCFKNVVKSEVTWGNEKTTAEDEADVFSGFDLSLPVGLSYQIGRYVIGARYNIGLTNVYAKRWNTYSDKPSARNSVFQLSLGYRFDL